MTSTPFNVGLGDSARASSRVLRPPGGGHTDIFGGEEPLPTPRGRRGAPPASNGPPMGQGDEPKPTNGTAPAQNGQATPASTPEAPPEAPKETPKPQVQAEPARAEAPKRVRVPPGGFSSGLW